MSERQRPLHPAQPDWVYEKFAEIYDLLVFQRFSDLAHERCERFLADSELSVSRLLDLACGTGHFALRMAAHGVEVTGVDAARTMLSRARRNARGKRNPRWIRGRFTDFRAPGRFDLVTCWFDSLNHLLSDDEMVKCFRRVRSHLTPGGAFLFDVNTPVGFRHGWRSASYRSHERYSIHQHGLTDAAAEFGWLEFEVFVRRGKRYERYQLPFIQRSYAAASLRRMLRVAGFDRISIEAFAPPHTIRTAPRLFVSAHRPGRRTGAR
jgi:SAM-dependent methyltransferase